MQFTANFRSQHDDAIAMADRIGAMAEALGGDADGRLGDEIAERLGQLTRVLRVHFAQEDQLLYPRLMASTDSITAATARSFFEEMGGLGPVYDAFSAHMDRPRRDRRRSGRLPRRERDRVRRAGGAHRARECRALPARRLGAGRGRRGRLSIAIRRP